MDTNIKRNEDACFVFMAWSDLCGYEDKTGVVSYPILNESQEDIDIKHP